MRWGQRIRGTYWNRLYPTPEMRKDMLDLTGHVFYVDQVGLDAISAEVGPQRGVKILRVIFQHRAQGAQLAVSPLRRTSCAGQEVGAVIGDQFTEIERTIARAWLDSFHAACS